MATQVARASRRARILSILAAATAALALPAVLAADEVEPNNTPGSANSLVGNPAYDTGSILPASDVDYWSMGGAEVGHEAFAFVSGPLTYLLEGDTTLHAIGNDGVTEIASNDDGGPGWASAIAGADVLEAGSVYFGVESYANSDLVVPYGLYAAIVNPAEASPESEPNDSFATATAYTAPMMTGSIGWGDTDVYRFTATAGTTFVVLVDADPDDNASYADVDVQVFDASGAPLDPARDLFGYVGSGPFTATASGDYFVQVRPDFLEDNDYSLVILEGRPFPADLAVTKTGPEEAAPETVITYEVTVSNEAGAVAEDVVITDTLVGATIGEVNAPNSLACATSGADTLVCTLDELWPGDSVTFTVSTTTPATDGTTGLINRVTVTSATSDENLSNNTAEMGTTVVARTNVVPVPPVGPGNYVPPEQPASPTATATAEPTEEPTVTPEPTEEPTAEPTEEPTEAPTATATSEPTQEPTAAPTATSTPEPTTAPATEVPTATPTRAAPMPPDTGSAGVTGGGSSIWIALLGLGTAVFAGGATVLGWQRRR